MAGEPRPGPARPGRKRQPGSGIFCNGNYDLNLESPRREDSPYRMYEYQRVPPLINQVPPKIRRTHLGMGAKSSRSPRRSPRKSSPSPPPPPGLMKLGTEELHSIRGELSRIKAQVDSLLERLERMDQCADEASILPGQPVGEDPSRILGSMHLERVPSLPPTFF